MQTGATTSPPDARTAAGSPAAPRPLGGERRRDAGARPDTDPEAERRRVAHTVIVGELREPMAAIARTLHRLSFQRLAPVPGIDGRASAHLVRRARTLANELQEVIDELLGAPADLDGREPQQTLIVLAALEDAIAEARPRLEGHTLEIDCPEQLTSTTHPTRFAQLAMCLVAEAAARAGEEAVVRLRVRRRAGELQMEAPGRADSHEPATARRLEVVRSIVRSLGGRVTDHDDDAGLVVRLPQERNRDGDVGAPGAPDAPARTARRARGDLPR